MNARYRDKNGDVATQISNDGKILSVVVRDVEFCGSDFDSLEPIDGTDATRLSSFTLQHGCLCSCTIDADMPLGVVVDEDTNNGLLSIHLELGEPQSNGRLGREIVRLELKLGKTVYCSRGNSGWFEDELLDIQRQLPKGTYLKSCVSCAFSDSSPYGHGLFGGLACFRENKAEYLSVKNKRDLFRVWDTMTEFVQETYLCREFQRRVPGTGYRG